MANGATLPAARGCSTLQIRYYRTVLTRVLTDAVVSGVGSGSGAVAVAAGKLCVAVGSGVVGGVALGGSVIGAVAEGSGVSVGGIEVASGCGEAVSVGAGISVATGASNGTDRR